MQRRIFIAINLSKEIKSKLQALQKKWADLPVRFTRRSSLHLTILFIGYVDDERMLEVCQKIREIGEKHKPFELNFNRVCLAPHGKPPRLIWLEGERNENLVNLKRDIEKMISHEGSDKRIFAEIERELKIFVPHITLARIRQTEWKKMPQKSEIDENISISISVRSIEVMESDLGRGGAEYIILESSALRG